jgi:superfamily II DNA or RNA helicase
VVFLFRDSIGVSEKVTPRGEGLVVGYSKPPPDFINLRKKDMQLTVENAVTRVEGTKEERVVLWQSLSYVDRYWAGKGWKNTTKSMFNRRANNFLTGLLPQAIDGMNKVGQPFKLVDARVLGTTPHWPVTLPGITFRDYQVECIEAYLKAKRGIIKAGTGAGKTLMSAGILKACQCPTIFLVHRTHLLYQTAEVYLKVMPEIKPYLGIVGDGSKELKPITLATVQTIDSMLKEHGSRFAKELEMFKLMMVDEAHRATGAQFEKVVTCLKNCDYRLGLTATPFMTEREEDDLRLKGLFDRIIYEISPSELIRKGVLARPYFTFYRVPESNDPKLKKLKNYRDIYEKLIIENTVRNEMIAKKTRELVNMGRKPLVICAELRHIELLGPMFESQGIDVAVVTGAASTAERAKKLKSLDSGRYDAIVCTTIFDEGVDLPNIGGVVMAAGNKAAPAIFQRTGRAIRKKEEDNYAVIVDFFDDTHPILRRQSEKRIEIIRREPEFRIVN